MTGAARNRLVLIHKLDQGMAFLRDNQMAIQKCVVEGPDNTELDVCILRTCTEMIDARFRLKRLNEIVAKQEQQKGRDHGHTDASSTIE